MSPEEVEEIKRRFGVIAESLRSDIQLIAEGHDMIRREQQSQREEMQEEFKEISEFTYSNRMCHFSNPTLTVSNLAEPNCSSMP